jgi:hypothetical protein
VFYYVCITTKIRELFPVLPKNILRVKNARWTVWYTMYNNISVLEISPTCFIFVQALKYQKDIKKIHNKIALKRLPDAPLLHMVWDESLVGKLW